MNTRAQRWIGRLMVRAAAVVALVALGAYSARDAHADLSKKVIKAFKGQILVTDGALGMGASDKETIAEFKKARLKVIKGTPNADEVTTWTFHYTAFLKKTGATSLAFEFHVGGKYVADQRLEGVDSSLTVLEGDIQITEDDGPAKNKDYTLKLIGKVKGKEVVLATTPLRME